MIRNTTVPPLHDHDTMCHYPLKRICWSAIFVGALVAIGLGFLLNLFGMAIGITAMSMDEQGAFVVSVGGLIGILIGVIASMLVAGYASGYLGRLYCPRRNLGILYGFATWSLALILSAVLAAYASEYIENYTNNLSSTVVITTDSENSANLQTSNDANPDRPAAVKATPETLAWSAFLVFVLFVIGAISACIGALWGMTCPRDDLDTQTVI
jgi:hypothetical protein